MPRLFDLGYYPKRVKINIFNQNKIQNSQIN